jgi:lysozyme family protein
MKNFERALIFVLKIEGGYVNDPLDPGGETKFGISKRSYPDIDIKNMTLEGAGESYKKDYWDKCKCDELPDSIAIILFDTAVNMGVQRAIKLLQDAAGVLADGIIGQKTISAVCKTEVEKLILNMLALRIEYYAGLGGWNRYGLGWTKRCFDVYREAITASQAV